MKDEKDDWFLKHKSKLEKIQKVISDSVKKQKELSETVGKAISDSIENHRDLSEKVSKAIAQSVSEAPKSLKELVNYGWYISLDSTMGFVIRVAHLIKVDQEDEANQLIIEYLEECEILFKNDLEKNWPHRNEIINQAISAHKRGEYFLSIPVFFSQSEGICEEAIGVRLFSKDRKTKSYKTAIKANEIEKGSILDIIIEPLRAEGIMRKNQDKSNPIGINRHDVIHGNSIDYGTKINSFKALSLLYYIVSIMNSIKEEEND